MKDKKTLSREIGLEIGTLCGRHLLNLQHLHYGYWTDNLSVELQNLPAAQEHYTDFLLSHIPEDVHDILDVGCGMGHNAKRLTALGRRVDCVSPSAFLARQAKALLNGQTEIFECSYEQLQTEKRYDLILFSESFQYIDPAFAVKKTLSLLRPGGRLLICDVFKRDVSEKSPIAGGHYLSAFFQIVNETAFTLVTDVDITDQTAPNRDIENGLCKDVLEPTSKLLEQLLDSRYPVLSKFLKWKYHKKITKLNAKYFSNLRTAETFRKFKTYRLLLYQLKSDL